MGTRCGELDAGVVLYLIQQKGMSPDDLVDLLYKRSGMLGLAGVSSDFRELLASDAPRARFAIELFCNRVARQTASLVAGSAVSMALCSLPGSATMQRRFGVRSAADVPGWLGAEFDEAANQDHKDRISTSGSRVAAYVIKTDENLMIARQARALVGG
jgi:acetate kinase